MALLMGTTFVEGSSHFLLKYKIDTTRNSPDITSPCLPNAVAFFKYSSYDDYNPQLSQRAEVPSSVLPFLAVQRMLRGSILTSLATST